MAVRKETKKSKLSHAAEGELFRFQRLEPNFAIE